MTGRPLFAILAILTVILAILPYEGGILCWPRALALAALLTQWGLWRSIIKPAATVSNGLDLLSAQDYNNRLAPVGQRDADRIATLFNSLMDRLHNERLRLRERDKLLSQLIEASPMGVAMMDFDGRITDVNSSFRTLADLPADFNPTGMRLNEIDSPLVSFAAGVPRGSNMVFRAADTRIFRCYSLSFMESGFQRPFILLESLTEEMMQAERDAYGKVIRLISHEVNNSLGGVSALLELLAEIHSSDPDMADSINSVNARCRELTRFIGAYADVVKLPDPDLRPVSLPAIISRNIPFLESLTGRRLTVVNYLQPEKSGGDSYGHPSGKAGEKADTDPGMILADEAMLGQVLLNIVKNASESIAQTGGEGEISIILDKTSAAETILEITDNGGGISPSTSSRLFNPFFSTKRGGRGIGLTLVAEILRRHNCRFTLRTGPDLLTRFRIAFPSLN